MFLNFLKIYPSKKKIRQTQDFASLQTETKYEKDDYHCGHHAARGRHSIVKNGVIENIEVLENQESPSYLKRATSKVLPQYIGKTVAEAKKLKADVATGATYTSEALIKNIQMGLEKVKSTPAKKSTTKKSKKRR